MTRLSGRGPRRVAAVAGLAIVLAALWMGRAALLQGAADLWVVNDKPGPADVADATGQFRNGHRAYGLLAGADEIFLRIVERLAHKKIGFSMIARVALDDFFDQFL